jgi:CDP-diacylglycerol---serine O-phosphatidyltransferase
MKIKKYIPNTLTLINLFSGCLSVVFAFNEQLHISAILVLIAAVFDFLDGFAARILKSYSALGKELDSLADLVSFGLAPAIVIFMYLRAYTASWVPEVFGINILAFSAFLITLISALRLAKFNIDDRQTESFIGLPTPANAIFFISFPLILKYGSEQSFLYAFFNDLTRNFYGMLFLTLCFSYLLISNLPLFSLKFKNFGYKSNQVRYIFVALSAILILVFGVFALPMIIALYIVLSLIEFAVIGKHM